MDLVKTLKSVSSVKCEACCKIVTHVDGDCFMCDQCIAECEKEFSKEFVGVGDDRPVTCPYCDDNHCGGWCG